MANPLLMAEIFDNINEGIYILNRKGDYIYCNNAFLKMVGATREEALSLNAFQLIPEGQVSVSVAVTAFTEKKKVSVVNNVLTPKGYHYRQLATATPIFGSGGEVEYMLVETVRLDLLAKRYQQAILYEDDSTIEVPALSPERARAKETIIADSPAMQAILQTAAQVAQTDSTVLISGETGTGKEVLAKYIHRNSSRADAPIIEINSLPLALQGKFLRVLESHKSKRLGAVEEQEIDFRLLAATNQNLKEGVLAGTFRADLYYRLNVIPLELPPLRERREDIAPLATFFLDYYCKRYSRTKVLSRRVIEQLKAYDWPGNIRELKNVVERLLVTSAAGTLEIYQDLAPLLGEDAVRSTSPEIYPADWEAFYQFDPEHFSLKAYMEFCEKHVLADALKRCPSSYKAAALLKTDQSTIVRKRKKYGL